LFFGRFARYYFQVYGIKGDRAMFDIAIPAQWITIAAGGLVFVLGIVYIIKTKDVVADFRLVLIGHRRILSMAIACLGIFLCFTGGLVACLVVMGQRDSIGKTIILLCAGMLLILSLVTSATGGRTDYVLFKIGQFGMMVAGLMMIVGILLHT
jgi:hypothetical protein